MTNPYEFELNGLKVVVYAENKEKAKEIFVQKTKVFDEWKKEIRANAIDDCIQCIMTIMPSEPFLKRSKHYEKWKTKTTELRTLLHMLELLKEC